MYVISPALDQLQLQLTCLRSPFRKYGNVFSRKNGPWPHGTLAETKKSLEGRRGKNGDAVWLKSHMAQVQVALEPVDRAGRLDNGLSVHLCVLRVSVFEAAWIFRTSGGYDLLSRDA